MSHEPPPSDPDLTGAVAAPPAVVPWQPPAELVGPAPGLAFAPHGARIVAYLIDGVILTMIDLVLAIPIILASADLAQTRARPDSGQIALFVLLLLGMVVINLLYFPAFWANGGQTPGMRPFGLRVVRDRDGGSFGWGTALLRTLGLYVASAVFYLGFIWIFIDRRRRGWHDLIAGTVVVKHVVGPGR